MKNQIKNSLFIIGIFFILFSIFSCKSLPEEPLLGEYYTYDYELFLNFTEANFFYEQTAGFKMQMDYTKTIEGSVVFRQENRFVEPDFGYTLIITKTGGIYSPDNPSVTGRLKTNGQIYWQGFEETAGVIRNFLVKGTFKPCYAYNRASSDYDGSYILTDSGSGREQQVLIHNGLCFWEYTQKQEEDFEPWPLIVNPDGTIKYTMSLLTRTSGTGMYDMTYETTHFTEGKVVPGSISLSSVTKTIGNQSDDKNETNFNYVGTTASKQLNEKMQKNMNQVLTNGSKSKSVKKTGTPPVWFIVDLDANSDVLVGRGMKQHTDKETALKLAEITAVSDLICAKSIIVASNSLTKQTNQEKSLYQIVDTISKNNVQYRVINSFYDSTNSIAYVMVEEITR